MTFPTGNCIASSQDFQSEAYWAMGIMNPPLPGRHWFLSAICAAGATDTFRFLKQKIHDEKLNIWEAAATLPLAFHFVTPNKQTLEVASVSTDHSSFCFPLTPF